jgi:hypothetical protein
MTEISALISTRAKISSESIYFNPSRRNYLINVAYNLSQGSTLVSCFNAFKAN